MIHERPSDAVHNSGWAIPSSQMVHTWPPARRAPYGAIGELLASQREQ